MKEKSGMKSAHMPQEHWTKSPGEPSLGGTKYASKSTMENPEDLKESVNKLSGYIKKHKMKY